jgi:hypothetical protein
LFLDLAIFKRITDSGIDAGSDRTAEEIGRRIIMKRFLPDHSLGACFYRDLDSYFELGPVLILVKRK